MNKPYNVAILLIISACVITYLVGLFISVLDVDSAQYATISLNMFQTGNYLELYDRGRDYLDKPPFIFWISCLSYKLLGISDFSFKLPSFLFFLLAVYSTYDLAKSLYNKKVAVLSAVILSTNMGFFLANLDVKTDIILIGGVMFGTNQLYKYFRSGRPAHIIYSAFGIGIALITKGPLGLLIPAIALSPVIIKERGKLLKWQWLAWAGIIILIMLPMLIGLYMQFDLHRDKIVNTKTNVSGLWFYFWEQSFGRLTGENILHNTTDPFYMFHSFLLCFLPWSHRLIAAFVSRIISLFKKGSKPEIITITTFLLPLIALSFSHYKTPYYSLIVFPFAAVLTASEWYGPRNMKWLTLLDYFIGAVFVIAATAALVFFPYSNKYLYFIPAIIGAAMLVIVASKNMPFKTEAYLSSASVLLAFVCFTAFLPVVIMYQPGGQLAEIFNEEKIDPKQFYYFNANTYSLEFKIRNPVTFISYDEIIKRYALHQKLWVLMNIRGLEAFNKEGLKPQKVIEYNDYDKDRISLDFINPATRMNVIEKKYLVLY